MSEQILEFGSSVGVDFLGGLYLNENGVPVSADKRVRAINSDERNIATITKYLVEGNLVIVKKFKEEIPTIYVTDICKTVVRGSCFKSGVLMEYMADSCDVLFKRPGLNDDVRVAFEEFMKVAMNELERNNLIMTDMKLHNIGATRVNDKYVFRLLDVDSIAPSTVKNTSTYVLGFSGLDLYLPPEREQLYRFACAMTVLHAYKYKTSKFTWANFKAYFPTNITEKQQFMDKNIPIMKENINNLGIDKKLNYWKTMALDALDNVLVTLVDTTTKPSGSKRGRRSKMTLRDMTKPLKKLKVV